MRESVGVWNSVLEYCPLANILLEVLVLVNAVDKRLDVVICHDKCGRLQMNNSAKIAWLTRR
jgi:hypothetical protein